ncbi:MAG: SdrD B-like domain-containing protein, partial [Sarcina sp.]
MLFVDIKTNDIQYTPMNLIDLEVAASVIKTVDKTTVKTLDVFTYTINASFSGLTGSIVGAQVKDFIPSYLNYFLPPIQAPLVNIIETPVAGGTELTFDFGTITDTGISIVITLGASFKQGTPNGQVFTNTIDQYVNGSIVNTTTAPPVTLSLVPNWSINKYIASPASGQATPGSTVTYNLVLTNTGDPGAVATNIVVTDTLPAGMTPDLSFTPTGIDVSNTDPNVIGLTGSWSGNTMTFNVPSYYGTNYKISYKAIIDPNATIGQTITNTGNLSINGTGYPSSSSTLTIANSTTSAAISKYGAEHAYPGAFVTYPIYFTNTGNQDLTNAVLIDTVPPEIIVKQVVPGKVCSPSGCPTMNITISYELNNNGIYILLGSYANEAYQRIDLPTITPPDKVTSVKWEFPVVPVSGGSSVAEGERITGIIDPNTTAASTTNVVTLTADGLAPVSASIITLLDSKNTPSVTKENSPTTNVIPGQTIKYTLSAFNYWGPYIEPIYADLLPPEVDYDNNVLYRLYYAPSNQTIFSTDPNFTNFLQPLPPEVIPNYMGTGRTLVRFKFAPGTIMTQESFLQIDFNVKVKVGATGTIVNNGVFGDPGDNMISTKGQLTQVDTLDLDGDGNTTELLILSNNVTNGINFSTSLASDKKVKGSLDAAYTEWPNVGITTAGGTIDYKLTVTNTGNVNLESFEIIDILPHIGDTGVILNTIPRGSQFTVYQISAVNAVLSPSFPGDPTPILNLDYSTSYDPIRFSETDTTGNSIGTGTWQTTVPVPITSTAAFKITSVNTKLKPGQSIVINIVCIAPLGAPTDLVAWNSFALRGSYLDQNGSLAYLLPVEPQQVGVKIQPQAPTVAALGDYVWYDTNGNGIQDPGEPGINGIVVNLYDSTGTILLGTTVTAPDFNANDGFYQFGNLQPGCYFVEFIKPNNTFAFSPKGQGTDPTKDSNVNPATGFTDQVCLVAGEYNDTIDAGLTQDIQAFIGNLVWNDLNQNGIQDPGEPGVGNVTVNLLDTNGNVIKTTTTDPTGNYFFSVTPGCYFVEFVKPAGYAFTLQNVGSDDNIDSDADPVTGITPQVCVVASEVNNTIDAGIYIPEKAHLGDFVWNDLNANGIQDAGEPSIPGVTVQLLDSNANVIATTTTDANGLYNFDVDAGCYSVKFIKPTGYSFTLQNVGSDPAINSNADPMTGIAPQVCLTAGQTDLTIDAGLYQMASIGDFVWNDLNQNGLQDAGEPGIAGVTVNLLDNTTGAVLQTTTTDVSGK